MKKCVKFGILLLPVLILMGCQKAAYEESNKEFESLTLASINRCIQVSDDPLEASIIYSTRPCYITKHGAFGIEWDDLFIRGGKHKKSGDTLYSIFIITYSDIWQFPYQLNYDFNGDLITSQATKISSDVSCSSSRCTHKEIVAFDIREDYLADLSAKYDENETYHDEIDFRLQTEKTPNRDWTFNSAELVGLYRMVNGIK